MAIDDDILPALTNPKAQAAAVMIQSLLQGLRQTLPVLDRLIVEEHNEMPDVFRQISTVLAAVDGPVAERVRERADEQGARADLPVPDDAAIAEAAHRELGRALEATMFDLDELQRSGVAVAAEALQIIRGHLGPRYVRDVEVGTVGAGFVGRG